MQNSGIWPARPVGAWIEPPGIESFLPDHNPAEVAMRSHLLERTRRSRTLRRLLPALFSIVLLCALTPGFGRAQPPRPPYSLGQWHPTAGPSVRAAAGDFDGDGLPDVASLQQPRRSSDPPPAIEIWINQGGLRLAPRGTMPPARALASSDFDGDGRDDLVLRQADRVDILRSTGAGFEPYTSIDDVTDPRSMLVGDFDRDGRPDVAVGEGGGSPSLRVYLHRGGFASPSLLREIPLPGPIGAGDFDGDGFTDFLISDASSLGMLDSRAVLVRGSASGLMPPIEVHPPGFVTSWAAEDLDRDGADDALLGTLRGAFLWWGGSSPFTGRDQLSSWGGYEDDLIAITGDANGDGMPDVEIGDDLGMHVFRNLGQRAFEPGPYWFAGVAAFLDPQQPHWATLADLDDDGTNDWLWGCDTPTGPVIATLRGLGGGVFGGLASMDAAPLPVPYYLTRAAAIDFGRHHGHDLLVGGGTASLILRQRRDGSMAPAEPFEVRGTPMVAELDRDPRADIVGATPDSFYAYRTKPNGTLFPPRGYAGQVVTLTDIDGDGSLDALTRTPAGAVVRYNDGHGRFAQAGRPVPLSVPFSAVFGDLDGDRRADMAFALRGILSGSPGDVRDTLVVLLGLGDGRFAFHWRTVLGPYSVFIGGPGRSAIADVDGDGDLDVVTTSGGDGTGSAVAHVALNPGNGRLRYDASYEVSGEAQEISLEDFNLDGLPDIATLGHSGTGIGRFLVRLNQGAGRFDELTFRYDVLPYPRSLTVGDFNDDGLPDAAFIGAGGQTSALVSIAYNVLGHATPVRGHGHGHGHDHSIAPENSDVPDIASPAIAWRTGAISHRPELSITLPRDGAARIEVFDLSGRRLWADRLSGGPGEVHLALPSEATRASGVVWVRVSQDDRRAVAKIAVLR